MNWQKSAIEDLRKHEAQVKSLENIRLRIAALASSFEAIKCGLSDSTPVQGGASRGEERMINNIAERKRLEHTYRATKRLVELVEKGLDGLAPEERRVLELMFIHRERGAVDRLMEEMHLEKTRVYEIKDRALYKFTTSMYGLIDY